MLVSAIYAVSSFLQGNPNPAAAAQAAAIAQHTAVQMLAQAAAGARPGMPPPGHPGAPAPAPYGHPGAMLYPYGAPPQQYGAAPPGAPGGPPMQYAVPPGYAAVPPGYAVPQPYGAPPPGAVPQYRPGMPVPQGLPPPGAPGGPPAGTPRPAGTPAPSDPVAAAQAAAAAATAAVHAAQKAAAGPQPGAAAGGHPRGTGADIKAEVVINDAPTPGRISLTKRTNQEEITKRSNALIVTRGRYYPGGASSAGDAAHGRNEGEKPLFLKITPSNKCTVGATFNTAAV